MNFVPVTDHPLATFPPVQGPGDPAAPAAADAPAPAPAAPPPAAPAAPAADPALADAVANGAGPDLNPGTGRAGALGGRVAPAHDWDFSDAAETLEMTRASVAHLKQLLTGKEDLAKLGMDVERMVDEAVAAAPGDPRAQALDGARQAFRRIVAELVNRRAALTAGVSEGSSAKGDPREALGEIRKTLRAFRYDMQRALDACGLEGGSMDRMEKGLRAAQNLFTFGVERCVGPERVRTVLDLESDLANRLAELNRLAAELSPGTRPAAEPPGIRFADAVGPALELSHRTNDRIRDFQDAGVANATLRGVVGPLVEKGGSRSVEISVGVAGLLGLGFSANAVAGLRAGARFRVVAEVQCSGKGRPISVTYRLGAGLEGSAEAKARVPGGIAEVRAKASAGVEGSYFSTRSYPTLDDLALDASRCRLACLDTLPGMALNAGKALGRAIDAAATRKLRDLGRHSGEIKMENAAYFELLRQCGAVGSLDRILAPRANPLIVNERTGVVLRGQLGAEAGASFGSGIADVSLSANASKEAEALDTSRTWVPAALAIDGAEDLDALAELMRPGPGGGDVPAVPVFPDAEAAADAFDDCIKALSAAAARKAPASDAVWAQLANDIRSAMIGVKAAALAGRIGPEDARNLFRRFSDPSVRLPADVFREYLMDGSGAAKPAKIRQTSSAKIAVSLFKGWTDGLVEGVADPFLNAISEGGMEETRHQLGLDGSLQYRYSVERPARPGADPRPWENVEKETHELTFTDSLPVRAVIGAIARSAIRRGRLDDGETDEANAPGKIAKDVAADFGKDAGVNVALSILPGLIGAGAKEGSRAAAVAWIDAHERELLLFARAFPDTPLSRLTELVEWAAEHREYGLREAAKAVPAKLVPFSEGAAPTSGYDRLRTVRWTFADGAFDGFSVSSDTVNRKGVEYASAGTGFGFAADASWTVRQSLGEYGRNPRPTLVSLLGTTETFLFADVGGGPVGNGEAFKNWLARNFAGVDRLRDTLFSGPNLRLYMDAQAAAAGDLPLQNRLQDAWHAVRDLPADATRDVRLDAMRRLLVGMTLAFRTPARLASPNDNG